MSGASLISKAQVVSRSSGQLGATVGLAVASVGLAVGLAVGAGVDASVVVASASPLPELSSSLPYSPSPSSSPDPSSSPPVVGSGASVVNPCSCHWSNQ